MDLGRSPTSVLLGQALDQLTNLLCDLGSSAAPPGAPTPVEAETSAVSADDGGGLDDDEDLGPAGLNSDAGWSKKVCPAGLRWAVAVCVSAPRPAAGGLAPPARYHSDCERKLGGRKGKRGWMRTRTLLNLTL
jgi:hypothetical protein